MSIKVMNYVWEHSKATGTARLTLLALADSCNDDGEWSPGIAKLSQKVLLSERQTQRCLKELQEIGEIRILLNQGVKTQSGNTNRYQMVLYRQMHGIERGDIHVANKKKAVTPMSPQAVTPMSPKPSVKPSVKPPVTDDDDHSYTARAQDDQSTPSSSSSKPAVEAKQQVQPPLQQRPPAPVSGAPPPPTMRDRRTDADYAAVCTQFESNGFGLITPIIAKTLSSLLDNYPKDWIEAALTMAVRNGRRNLAYLEGILRNWKAEGFDYDQWRNGTTEPSRSHRKDQRGALDQPGRKRYDPHDPSTWDRELLATFDPQTLAAIEAAEQAGVPYVP